METQKMESVERSYTISMVAIIVLFIIANMFIYNYTDDNICTECATSEVSITENMECYYNGAEINCSELDSVAWYGGREK